MRAFLNTTLFILLFGCANVTAPTGGPKDEKPPALQSTIPKQGQTNYKGSRILLEFDESLKLKNPKEEIIITPAVKDAKFSAKKNLMIIDFEEKLKDSTTYSISFRESIQDLNEGNPAEDLNLAFSTGNEIDSLRISGTVEQLLKGQPADKYTVAVYQSDTFNIFKHKPVYFTRTNKEGKFKILNLKAGDYSIYAFEDRNKNLLLESKTEKFGIQKEKIALYHHTDSVKLKTIALDSRPVTIAGIRSIGHFTKVRFNKNLVSYRLTSLDPSDKNIRHCFSASLSEIDIYPSKPVNDSTRVRIIAIDSLDQQRDSVFYIKQTAVKSQKDKIKISSASATFNEDTQKFSAELSTTELLKNILPDSMYIQVDSTIKVTLKLDEIKLDTIFRKIRIEKLFQKKDSIKWKNLNLTIANMAFTSIHGDSTRKQVIPITYITPEETAILIIESSQTKSSVLLELLDDRYNPLEMVNHGKLITIKNIKPGSVLLRAIVDTNHNGKWDPGNPNLKILPEEIIYYTTAEGKQQIPLRANWEVNIKWNF
jgi:uncharacterized protein (DUF2141 family)